MTAKYFAHSPRGFSNEVNIYAVPADIAAEWREWLERDPRTDYIATAFNPITRKQAERMLRRDGVALVLPYDVYREIGEPVLSPRLVAEAKAEAVAWYLDAERRSRDDAAYEAAAIEQYHEFVY